MHKTKNIKDLKMFCMEGWTKISNLVRYFMKLPSVNFTNINHDNRFETIVPIQYI